MHFSSRQVFLFLVFSYSSPSTPRSAWDHESSRKSLYSDDLWKWKQQIAQTNASFRSVMCFLSLVDGQGSGAIRGGRSRSKGTVKKTTTVATTSTSSPPLIMEETSLIESASKHTSTSSVAAIDRIHPLSDLSLFEPGELSPSQVFRKTTTYQIN